MGTGLVPAQSLFPSFLNLQRSTVFEFVNACIWPVYLRN